VVTLENRPNWDPCNFPISTSQEQVFYKRFKMWFCLRKFLRIIEIYIFSQMVLCLQKSILKSWYLSFWGYFVSGTCNLTQTLRDLSLHGYENCKTCTSCEMKYPIFYMASRLISFFLENIKAIAFYVSFLQLFRILAG